MMALIVHSEKEKNCFVIESSLEKECQIRKGEGGQPQISFGQCAFESPFIGKPEV